MNRILIAAFMMLAAAATPSWAQFCPGCVQNTAAPQNAQINIGTATIRGSVDASTGTFTHLHATFLDVVNFIGNGSLLTNLNASQLASGVVAAARLVGSYTGITGVGTLATGIWNATPVGTQYGGTGQNFVTQSTGTIPYFSSTGVMAALPPSTAGKVLQTNSTSSGPSWTSAPQILGTNVTGIPLANLASGTLPTSITVSTPSLTAGIPAAAISGNIPGGASFLTSALPISNLAAGQLPTSNPASSITVTGVSPGTYGGPIQMAQITVRPDGRIQSASQSLLSVPTANISTGPLPSGVTIAAADVSTGVLHDYVVASSLTATGVGPGSYGDATRTVTLAVRPDGRLNTASQQLISIPPTQLTAGALPGNITVPAQSISTGSLHDYVVATKVANSGVAPGTYGSITQIPQFTVGLDGRLTSAVQILVPSLSTTTVARNIDNNWVAPQTFQSSVTVNANLSAQAVTATSFVGNGSGLTFLNPATLTPGNLPVNVVASSIAPNSIFDTQVAPGANISQLKIAGLPGMLFDLAASTTALSASTSSLSSSIASLSSTKLDKVGTSSLTITGGPGTITTQSSVTASAFFGDGSGLTNVSGSDPTKVPIAGGFMTGPLTMINSTITVGGNAFSVGGTTLVVRNGKVSLATTTTDSTHELIVNGQIESHTDGSFNLFEPTGYGGIGGVRSRTTRGSLSSPTAVQVNDAIGQYTGTGWNGSTFPSSTGGMAVYAAETYTSTATGSYVRLFTTPVGTTTLTGVVLINPTGDFGIGTVIPASKLEVIGDITSKGTVWTTRATPLDRSWTAVTYGNGFFVSISSSGTTNSVMTSPDGINWSTRTTPTTNSWRAITYGKGLFVAVANSGSGNRVMTSPDGVTWTIRSSAADNSWNGVTYGNGLYVAVAISGVGNRVMTSPDGITWTLRTSAADNDWRDVNFGNGLFVAVSDTGIGNRVMTSPDGITWTLRTSANDNNWNIVNYGNGLFVAAGFSSVSNNSIMTSPNGITWTGRASPTAGSEYSGVVYGNGLYVAVTDNASANGVITSTDAYSWRVRGVVSGNRWESVTYGNGIFVAVADTGTGDRAMSSGKSEEKLAQPDNIYHGGLTLTGDLSVSGNITGTSSVTASAFFGNGAGISGVTTSDPTKVSKTGDTMTGQLLMSGSSIALTGSLGTVISQSSVTASAFFGDGSALTGVATTGSLAAETAARIAADNALAASTTTLQSNINAEAATRLAADVAIGASTASLRSDLTVETSSRITADNALAASTTTLQSNINAETASRIAADNALAASTTTLQSNINAETASRIAADNALAVSTTTLQSNIDAEAATRLAADIAIGASTAALSSSKLDKTGTSALVITGAAGSITTGSSVTASAFFGNGANLTNIQADVTKVSKTGDTMTGQLLMSGSSIALTGSLGTVTSKSSVTASAFFGDGANVTGIAVSSFTPISGSFSNTTYGVGFATVTMTTRGGDVTIILSSMVENTNAGKRHNAAFVVDGNYSTIKSVSGCEPQFIAFPVSCNAMITVSGLSSGSHTFAVLFKTSANTGTVDNDTNNQSQFGAREIR